MDLPSYTGSVIIASVRAARRIASALRGCADFSLALDQFRVGIWGRVRPLDTALCERDRIEVYRPLMIDPKDARRLRHRQQRGDRLVGLARVLLVVRLQPAVRVPGAGPTGPVLHLDEPHPPLDQPPGKIAGLVAQAITIPPLAAAA